MAMGSGPGTRRVPAAPPATLCNSWSPLQDRSHALGAAGHELPLGEVVCPQYHLTSARRTRVQQKSLASLVQAHAGYPFQLLPCLKPRELGCLLVILPHGCSKSCICLWTSEAGLQPPTCPCCPVAPRQQAALLTAPHFPWGLQGFYTWRNTRKHYTPLWASFIFPPFTLSCEYF